MTSLVTGASGFVGHHVVRLLVARGHRVRVFVRPESDRRALAGLPVEIAYGDVRSRTTLREALRGVSRVFHVAADYRLWAKTPQDFYETNVQGTRHLLELASAAGVDRVVHTSSVATIAVPRPGVLPDESTIARLDEMVGHYKRSKLLAEQEVLRAAAAGLPAVVVNPTTPIGQGDWKPTPTGRILVDFLRGRMVAHVETGLNLVAVEDVAAGHLLAAERGVVGERYVLGSRNVTLKELFAMLSRVTDRRAPRATIPHGLALAAAYVSHAVAWIRGTDPAIPIDGVRMARHAMFVDDSKARRELGFEPGPIEPALARAVQWYVDNGYVPGPTARRTARGGRSKAVA
jgi:dihydroflavonol-4-reductase